MIRLGDYITTKEDEKIVLKILHSNKLSEGKYVKEFEEKWAEFCGTKYCVLTNSGTSALILSLETLKYYTKIREVLTSPNTFIATVNAIVLSGFEPVFADVETKTFSILPPNEDYDIFMPVHLYGYPVNMDMFHCKYMIEDACQAHGTIYKGKPAGSIGLMGCFSFYIAHNIQIGDMGAVVTSNEGVYKLLKKLKAHGRLCECMICRRNEGRCPHRESNLDPRFTHTHIAFNFKTSEIQAALGLNQLKHAQEIIHKRQENVEYLNEGLKYLNELRLPRLDHTVSYLAYPVIIQDWEVDRNDFCRRLTQTGVENRPFFSCVPTQQPAYEYIKEKWKDKLPNAQWLGEKGFHIGIHQYLTKEDLDFMIKAIRQCLSQ